MNGELRSAMHKKHMLYSHFTKNKNVKTWDKYRRQRNLATKLKKTSCSLLDKFSDVDTFILDMSSSKFV
jgi:hypothetical protein